MGRNRKRDRKITLILAQSLSQYTAYLHNNSLRSFPNRYLYSTQQLLGIHPDDLEIIILPGGVDKARPELIEKINILKAHGAKVKKVKG